MPPNDLAVLMGSLQRTRSPWKRLEILARAWKQLRELTPEQRYRLALQVGLDGGEHALEALAEGTPELRGLLLEAVQSARETDPRKLQALLGDLKDPHRRAALVKKSLAAAEELVAPPPEAAPSPPKAAPSPPAPQPEVAPSRPSAAPEAPPPSAPPSRPPPPAPPPVAAPPPTQPTPAAVPPVAPEPRRTEPEPPPAPPEPSREPEADRPPLRPLPELASVPLPRRFRLLREQVAGARDLEEIGRLLDAFPQGWARRRALMTVYRAGQPRDLDDAIALADRLERASDRRWCLRELLHGRPLQPEDRERLAPRLPQGVLRRARWGRDRVPSALLVPVLALGLLGPATSVRAGEAPPPDRRTLGRFLPNFVHDLGSPFTRASLVPLLVGASVTAIGSRGDARVERYFEDTTTYDGAGRLGSRIGGGVAVGASLTGLFVAGRLAHGSRFRAVTYDLAEATLVNEVYTVALKTSVRRRRPNGSNRYSFPSGHTSNAFAWATVAEEDLGPRVGVPAYLLAGFIGASRLAVHAHYLSDVLAGATVGIIVGRSVARRDAEPLEPRRPRMTLVPCSGPSGGGVGLAYHIEF